MCILWGAYASEDGHNQCVSCLGHSHAMSACEDPASCMNGFIMPARAGVFCLKEKGEQGR